MKTMSVTDGMVNGDPDSHGPANTIMVIRKYADPFGGLFNLFCSPLASRAPREEYNYGGCQYVGTP